jgi:outer membrane protein TolC
MYLYIPGIDSVRSYLDGFEDFIMKNYLGDDLNNLIYNHPELRLQQKSLDQAKVNLRYSVNQHKPDISMTGSLAIFESDELGYTSIPNSLGNLFKKPDGISWNLGLSYTFSLFSSPSNIQRQLAIEDYQEQQQNLEKTKENISLQANDFLFKLKSSHISLNSARNNLSYAQNIMKEGEQLYKIKRISRFDYNEYKKTAISETMSILEVYNNQMELMSQFMQFMGVKPALVLQLISLTSSGFKNGLQRL